MAEKKTMSIDEAFNGLDDQAATPATPAPPPPTMLQRAGTMASDLGKGLGESAVDLMSTGDEFARKHLPAFLTNSNLGFGPPANLEHVHDLATPANTTQTIGKGLGDAAQFLIPGGAEDALASAAPKALEPLARVGTAALSSGLVNKAQGGSFTGGAVAGGAAGALGAGAKAIAPKLAESALGITKADRAFGKTPGNSILEETRGFQPSSIEATGRERLNELTPELENAVNSSSRPFSMQPARDVVSSSMGRAARENAGSLHGQLGEMNDFLGRRFDSGEAIPDELTPRQGLDLKRGFSTEFLGRWNPETHGGTLSTGRNAYHALDSELDRTVPEAAELNQRISSLIPVVHRAESVSRNAPPAQLMMRRIAAPTGALVGPIFGGSEGYRQGGVPGAIAGAGLGLAAPLALTTPLGQMIMARGLNSAGAPAARYLGGGALQAARWMSHRGTGDQGQ